ncbi:MAG: CoA transferase [Dehalococcoidia bacterium]|nr:CoA transferase [Dehalococcoidia bacterium]
MGGRPLEGVRVVEVANFLAAPACAALMSDLGADVVKVEPPDGDVYRGHRTVVEGDPISYAFAVDNRGKRSITLDLDRPDARDVLFRLCRQADVMVTNLTPNRLKRYGLTYEEVSREAPGIVFALLTGYGPEGADADRPGFDSTAFFARSGIVSLLGDVSGPPVQSRAGQGDHMAALNLLAGVLAALRLRERTGEAQYVDVSLLRTGVWSIAADIQQALNREQFNFERQDRSTHWLVTRSTYETADGRWLQLTMPLPDRYWSRLAKAIDRPDLADDPRYTSTAAMRAHGPALLPEVEAIFRSHDLEHWRERLDAAGCIWGLIATPFDAAHDPQLRDQGAYERVTHPDGASYEVIAAPFRIHGADVRARSAAPMAGEHTHEVLVEYGFSEHEIADLAAREVFG